MAKVRVTRDLRILLVNPHAFQVADFRMEDDGMPPCICNENEEGCDKGDCPYCRLGGFAILSFEVDF